MLLLQFEDNCRTEEPNNCDEGMKVVLNCYRLSYLPVYIKRILIDVRSYYDPFLSLLRTQSLINIPCERPQFLTLYVAVVKK